MSRLQSSPTLQASNLNPFVLVRNGIRVMLIVAAVATCWQALHRAEGYQAKQDPRKASVVDCQPLEYSYEVPSEWDRPPHVRAGSSLQWVGKNRLLVPQDDNQFLALVDLSASTVAPLAQSVKIEKVVSLTLPGNVAGQRAFDSKVRKNKKQKWDLEASVVIPAGAVSEDQPSFVLLFGSGSATNRDVIILLPQSSLATQTDIGPAVMQMVGKAHWSKGLFQADTPPPNSNSSAPWDLRHPFVFSASELYSHLGQTKAFSGSELNIEGVVYLPATHPSNRASTAVLRLLQRGNGAVDTNDKGEQQLPVTATADISLPQLIAYFNTLLVSDSLPPLTPSSSPSAAKEAEAAAARQAAAPQLSNILPADLGSITHEGKQVPLSFTDACSTSTSSPSSSSTVYYVAGAEDSPDTFNDGEVVGASVGVLSPSGSTFSVLYNQDGSEFVGKVEGVVHKPCSVGSAVCASEEFLMVIDMDDTELPSQLCLVRLH